MKACAFDSSPMASFAQLAGVWMSNRVPKESAGIGRVSVERMGMLAGRLFREAEADLIRHDAAMPCSEQRREHLAPEIAPRRITVQQQDRITGPSASASH